MYGNSDLYPHYGLCFSFSSFFVACRKLFLLVKVHPEDFLEAKKERTEDASHGISSCLEMEASVQISKKLQFAILKMLSWMSKRVTADVKLNVALSLFEVLLVISVIVEGHA